MTVKQMVKWLLITILSVVLFNIASDRALVTRGSFAVGGEFAFLFLPFLWWGWEGFWDWVWEQVEYLTANKRKDVEP